MLIAIAIVTGFQAEIKNKVIGFSAHIQITQTSVSYTFENEPVFFDPFIYQKIKKIPEVKHIQIFASKPGIIKTKKAIEGIVLKGVGGDYDWTYINNSLKAGHLPKFSDTAISDEIIISGSQARKLNLKLNDPLVIYFIQQPQG